jgi:hypothetical protein
MRHILATGLLILGAISAVAQTPANHKPSTPAISTSSDNNAGAPAAGANSFTERQARSRIEAAGYSHVTRLVKDKDGVWRGKGRKGGARRDVGLDYQGNIVTD